VARLKIEAARGLAICDTDPAKLYYAYALAQTGRLDDAGWRAERDATRAAFAAGELGLPDLVFFAERDRETLERHRAADPTRPRHRFELQPWFKAWWDADDAVEPAACSHGCRTGSRSCASTSPVPGAPAPTSSTGCSRIFSDPPPHP
jgi:hypothetical protein